jgi:hypothetical protein
MEEQREQTIWEMMREAKQRRNERSINATEKLLKKHKIPFEYTNTPSLVKINNGEALVSLNKDKYHKIKVKFAGGTKWFTYGKDKFVERFKP